MPPKLQNRGSKSQRKKAKVIEHKLCKYLALLQAHIAKLEEKEVDWDDVGKTDQMIVQLQTRALETQKHLASLTDELCPYEDVKSGKFYYTGSGFSSDLDGKLALAVNEKKAGGRHVACCLSVPVVKDMLKQDKSWKDLAPDATENLAIKICTDVNKQVKVWRQAEEKRDYLDCASIAMEREKARKLAETGGHADQPSTSKTNNNQTSEKDIPTITNGINNEIVLSDTEDENPIEEESINEVQVLSAVEAKDPAVEDTGLQKKLDELNKYAVAGTEDFIEKLLLIEDSGAVGEADEEDAQSWADDDSDQEYDDDEVEIVSVAGEDADDSTLDKQTDADRICADKIVDTDVNDAVDTDIKHADKAVDKAIEAADADIHDPDNPSSGVDQIETDVASDGADICRVADGADGSEKEEGTSSSSTVDVPFSENFLKNQLSDLDNMLDAPPPSEDGSIVELMAFDLDKPMEGIEYDIDDDDFDDDDDDDDDDVEDDGVYCEGDDVINNRRISEAGSIEIVDLASSESEPEPEPAPRPVNGGGGTQDVYDVVDDDDCIPVEVPSTHPPTQGPNSSYPIGATMQATNGVVMEPVPPTVVEISTDEITDLSPGETSAPPTATGQIASPELDTPVSPSTPSSLNTQEPPVIIPLPETPDPLPAPGSELSPSGELAHTPHSSSQIVTPTSTTQIVDLITPVQVDLVTPGLLPPAQIARVGETNGHDKDMSESPSVDQISRKRPITSVELSEERVGGVKHLDRPAEGGGSLDEKAALPDEPQLKKTKFIETLTSASPPQEEEIGQPETG